MLLDLEAQAKEGLFYTIMYFSVNSLSYIKHRICSFRRRSKKGRRKRRQQRPSHEVRAASVHAHSRWYKRESVHRLSDRVRPQGSATVHVHAQAAAREAEEGSTWRDVTRSSTSRDVFVLGQEREDFRRQQLAKRQENMQ